MYGKQLQLLCKTHIQIAFNIVLKKQGPRQSHNMKKPKLLVNYFYTSKSIYIYTHTSKDWISHLLRHCIIILSPPLLVSRSPFPWRISAEIPVAAGFFTGGCFPPSTCTSPYLRLPDLPSWHWGAECLKKLLQWWMHRELLCDQWETHGPQLPQGSPVIHS